MRNKFLREAQADCFGFISGLLNRGASTVPGTTAFLEAYCAAFMGPLNARNEALMNIARIMNQKYDQGGVDALGKYLEAKQVELEGVLDEIKSITAALRITRSRMTLRDLVQKAMETGAIPFLDLSNPQNYESSQYALGILSKLGKIILAAAHGARRVNESNSDDAIMVALYTPVFLGRTKDPTDFIAILGDNSLWGLDPFGTVLGLINNKSIGSIRGPLSRLVLTVAFLKGEEQAIKLIEKIAEFFAPIDPGLARDLYQTVQTSHLARLEAESQIGVLQAEMFKMQVGRFYGWLSPAIEAFRLYVTSAAALDIISTIPLFTNAMSANFMSSLWGHGAPSKEDMPTRKSKSNRLVLSQNTADSNKKKLESEIKRLGKRMSKKDFDNLSNKYGRSEVLSAMVRMAENGDLDAEAFSVAMSVIIPNATGIAVANMLISQSGPLSDQIIASAAVANQGYLRLLPDFFKSMQRIMMHNVRTDHLTEGISYRWFSHYEAALSEVIAMEQNRVYNMTPSDVVDYMNAFKNPQLAGDKINELYTKIISQTLILMAGLPSTQRPQAVRPTEDLAHNSEVMSQLGDYETLIVSWMNYTSSINDWLSSINETYETNLRDGNLGDALKSRDIKDNLIAVFDDAIKDNLSDFIKYINFIITNENQMKLYLRNIDQSIIRKFGNSDPSLRSHLEQSARSRVSAGLMKIFLNMQKAYLTLAVTDLNQERLLYDTKLKRLTAAEAQANASGWGAIFGRPMGAIFAQSIYQTTVELQQSFEDFIKNIDGPIGNSIIGLTRQASESPYVSFLGKERARSVIENTNKKLNQVKEHAETQYTELITSANSMMEKYTPSMIK